MNWKDYELEIYEFFKSQYPDAEVSYNITIPGRYSKTLRQIDILIEAYIAGNRLRIIVDGKYFSSKIDVKDVEMFIAMVHDCDASKGLLITSEGYSQAALNRAYHDPHNIELDIMNFKELQEYQGLTGIPYSNGDGVWIFAPLGWVIDANPPSGMLATAYQRGLTFIQAAEKREFIYINIKHFDENIKSLDELISSQDDDVITHHSDASINYLPTIKRNDAEIRLRVIEASKYPAKEYTGFVAFKNMVLIAVMFSPDEVSGRNIRKLENYMQSAVPLQYVVDEFKWDVEESSDGTMLALDVKFLRLDNPDLQYLTVIALFKKNKLRPGVISLILPSDVSAESAISMSFLHTKKDEETGYYLNPENYMLTVPFNDITTETCIARIQNGYVFDVNLNDVVDIFEKMKTFDHLQVEFQDGDNNPRCLRIPLFDFKEKVKQLAIN